MKRDAALLVPMTVVLGIAYLLPLAWLIPESLREPTGGVGLGQYGQAFSESLYAIVGWRTLRIAALSGIACVAIAYPLAWLMSNLPRSWFRYLAVVIAIPLLTSTIVRSEAWVLLLLPTGVLNTALSVLPGKPQILLLNTELGVLIAMVQVLLPITLLPLLAAFYDLDRSLIAAGRNLGAGRVQVWRRIIIPLTSPAAVTSFGLTFLLALGFWVTPSIVGGGRTQLIAPLISQEASQLANVPFAAALSVLLVLVTGGLVLAFVAITRVRRVA
jgi:ABC-type spermidine/putrescine transport system permease subunit I